MADFNALEALINAHIKKNGVQAITGNILNGILRGMVSALGKGYTIAGVAVPSSDPGTMTGPLAYLAYTAGTYTHFGGLEVEQGEVAMLIYNEAVWHKEVLFSLAASATIDGNVGTPEVGVSFVDGLLTFDFRNMKGNPGDPAGFGTINATVDGNVGTPGVSVQSSGPDTAKNITFQFTNLKGETGVTSVVATVDNTVGTPTCTVSLVGQQLTLAFSGLKGAQGDTGSSVDYPFTIVNNLTTNDATQALSAAMGVQLEAEVSQLEAKVDDVLDITEETETINVPYTTTNAYIANWTPPQINSNANYRLSNLIHFEKGDEILYTGGTGGTAVVLVARYENNVWTILLIGDTSQTTQTFQYTVEDESGADIYFCWFNNTGVTIKRTRTTIDSQRLLTLEANINDIPALRNEVGLVADSVFGLIEDDLTSGYVSGKYINQQGKIATNSSFGYKEFSVRAGAKIVFYAEYANPSTAALAKKYDVSPGNGVYYESLVAGASYTSQTIEYTATEDMVVAVSFYTAIRPGGTTQFDRSITIETNAVESNTTNIDLLLNAKRNSFVQDIDFGFMFNRIAVIGDSLASGRVEGIAGQPDGAGSDFYGFSWLSFLAKRWRCDRYVNYSRGGQHTSDWITEWLPVMQADPTIYDAYFIALGTNNEYNESDPSGDQANYEAFIERYNSIIDDVRTKAPNAVIFLVSLYEKREGNTTLEEIAEERMATDKGIYYIDYANTADYLRYSPDVNWRGHFSSTGYAYVASVINQIVNRIVWENQTEEFWQQFAKYHNIRNDFGSTTYRPSASAVGVGFTYYDTTLGKMIMSNGTAWVNLDGTALS